MSSSQRRPAAAAADTPELSRTKSLPTPNSDRVEAKTDFLRSALEARRAKDAPATPKSADARSQSQATPSSNDTRAPSSKGSTSDLDPWLDNALSEEDHTPAPRSRRRPSEPAKVSRTPTTRQQQAESEAMKNKIFNMSLQSELLKKQNGELKQKLEEAEKRIDELEPLEERNIDLREENDRLTLRIQNLEEDLEDTQEKLLDSEDQNKTILQIQEEAVENMEKLNAALEEAADLLFSLEQEKAKMEQDKTKMQEEVAKLKAQVDESNRAEQFHDALDSLDGQSRDKQPSRVCSIDESRPSTSNFDSDYYSQPASPPVKPKNSKEPLSFKDRAHNLLDISLKSKSSMQDMQKRLSAASLKNIQTRKPSIVSVVETLVEAHNGSPPDYDGSPPARPTAPRYQTRPTAPARMPPMSSTVFGGEEVEIPTSPVISPKTPVHSNGSLRARYSEGRTSEKPSYTSLTAGSPYSPARSTKSAKSNRSHDWPLPPGTEPRQGSIRDLHSRSNETSLREQFRADASSPGYYQSLPAPESSVKSDDLTSRPDPDRWWKGVDRVRSVVDQGHIQNGGTPPKAPSCTALLHQPKAPVASPMTERDVLFNPSEDEEQFIRKVKGFKGYLGRRK